MAKRLRNKPRAAARPQSVSPAVLDVPGVAVSPAAPEPALESPRARRPARAGAAASVRTPVVVDYSYVIRDLTKIGILSAVIMAGMAILYVINH